MFLDKSIDYDYNAFILQNRRKNIGKLMYVNRTLENFVNQSARQFPVVMVTGPRQVGKTTFMQYLSEEERTYVSLDDPMVRSLAKDDPALFMQRFPPPLLMDEFQYAPELLPYIKMVVDSNRQPSLFWLTGSQQFHIMKGVSESLAGRVGVLHLLGFSRRELTGRQNQDKPFLPLPDNIRERLATADNISLKELYRLIWRGSFPEISLNKDMDWNLFYSSFVQTYLQRDILDLAQVGNEMAFLRFLRAAAARTAQMLNVSELARDADISPNTAKHWLSILSISGLIYLLQPYFTNLTRRLIKSPKLYFLDTGLCAYLTEWLSPETLEAGAMSGAILETWILTELLKSYWHNGRSAPFYYYRDKDQKEIDLLIVQNGHIYPLELKKTASPSKSDVRHFSVLEKLKMPVKTGGVICLAEQFLPLTSDYHSIPVSVI